MNKGTNEHSVKGTPEGPSRGALAWHSFPCDLFPSHFRGCVLGRLDRHFRCYAREHVEVACDQTRPTGLMACSQSGAVVAMEIFKEQDVIAPVRIFLKFLRTSIHRTFPV